MEHDFLSIIEGQPCYGLIQRMYEGKVARRSGLSYMNHIREGLCILQLLYNDDGEASEAYCVHPIFQSDRLLAALMADGAPDLALISPRAVVLGMEYRQIANGYTIKNKIRGPELIDIGPLELVHRMLVADKIQNKKDFMKNIFPGLYETGSGRVAEHGLRYFDSWLIRLGISQDIYTNIVTQLEIKSYCDG